MMGELERQWSSFSFELEALKRQDFSRDVLRSKRQSRSLYFLRRSGQIKLRCLHGSLRSISLCLKKNPSIGHDTCGLGFINEQVGKRQARLEDSWETIGSTLDSIRFDICLEYPNWLIQRGEGQSAIRLWETILKKQPGFEPIVRKLNNLLHEGRAKQEYASRALMSSTGHGAQTERLKSDASRLLTQYRFEEDTLFWKNLSQQHGINKVRCIAFDQCGAIYLNDVASQSIVKISSDGKLQWSINPFEAHSDSVSIGELGCFTVVNENLLSIDYQNQELLVISCSGKVKRRISLPLKKPLFLQYIPSNRCYHVSDNFDGSVIILDKHFKIIDKYELISHKLKPAQLLYVEELDLVFVAMSHYGIRSVIEMFRKDGTYLGRFTDFGTGLQHVAKLATDNRGHIFAVDHFGSIFKFTLNGRLIWHHREVKQQERLKYVVYRDGCLYISDYATGTIRKFFV